MLEHFLPMQFVGFYIWTKPKYKVNEDDVISKFLSMKGRIVWSLISIVSVLGYAVILKSMGGNTPLFDSMSTVFSVVAMVLMAYAFMEQWVLWIVVDIVTVIMWSNIVFLQGGLFNLGILVMWIAWLINAIYGFVNWIKLHKYLN